MSPPVQVFGSAWGGRGLGTRAERHHARAPWQRRRPAKPGYTIIKQTKSRWWEVRDPNDELVCAATFVTALAPALGSDVRGAHQPIG
jgi:hypothetical protein